MGLANQQCGASYAPHRGRIDDAGAITIRYYLPHDGEQALCGYSFMGLIFADSQTARSTLKLQDRLVSATVRADDMKKVGYYDATDGGLVSLLAVVEEAVVAVVFKERNDGRVEISLRSNVGYDVSSVAFALGGGGHKQAAGATVNGKVEAVQERVVPMLRQVIEQGIYNGA